MTSIMQQPLPVDGVIFGRSAFKTSGLILLCPILFLFGACIIWAKVTGQAGDSSEVTWKGLAIGILLVVVAPIMAFQLARLLWVRRRLVIGVDRIQMVEHLSGKDVVILQIPFANIAEFKYEITKTQRRTGIDLRNLEDPATYALSETFQNNKQVDGRHFCIAGGYRRGPRAVATEIERAYSKWSGK